jgi:gliding motility-associated-like protein
MRRMLYKPFCHSLALNNLLGYLLPLLFISIFSTTAFSKSNTIRFSCLLNLENESSKVILDSHEGEVIFIDEKKSNCNYINSNSLSDTTCIIVSVIQSCDTTGNIILEDSILFETIDCLTEASFCLEMELAQFQSFTLTDNGQSFNAGMQGCNFHTTYFYSLAAFLNIAPNGLYSLASLNINKKTFTIDSFQVMVQLLASINVWDPTGNWVLNGSTISGGVPGANYETLNLIQIATGVSTNLDVDLNQIPAGRLITLDTGFHELIISDLVTGYSNTVIANVVCDNCPDIYSDQLLIIEQDCDGMSDLCLDIPFQEFLFNYEIFDNGVAYYGVRKGCEFDTLSTCYLVLAIPDQGMGAPYSVDSWLVGEVFYSSDFNTLQELLNLMNDWDLSGDWVLDGNSGTICGGTTGQNYGEMEITQINTGALAFLEPDYVVLTSSSAIELDTGFHDLILIGLASGCTDTLNIVVECDEEIIEFDALLQVIVNVTDTFCLNFSDTIIGAINFCPDFTNGNITGLGIIPNTSCLEYVGTTMGLDTFCMSLTYFDGTIDTTRIAIQVIPEQLLGDTIPLSILVNCSETFCLDTSAFLAPIDTIFNDCENLLGNFAEAAILEPNCLEIMAFNIGGLDTACIVICDTTGFCDTMILLIDVIQPEMTTVYDTILINQSVTFCPDTSQLYGVVNSVENICDSTSGSNAMFEVIDSTFCIDFTPFSIGTDTACFVLCDDFNICDTTIYILTVINLNDSIIAVNDDTLTYTINPVTIDIFKNDIFDPNLLDYGVITGVNYGMLINNSDGSFTYQAEADFCEGIDSFTYFISNGLAFDTATVTVEVLCDEIIVFNGFSPNNDGINETLKIRGISNYPNNVVSVFNRWGNRVYFIEGYLNEDGWNGRFMGKDLPDGTYFYIIEDGEGRKYTGWLQLRR